MFSEETLNFTDRKTERIEFQILRVFFTLFKNSNLEFSLVGWVKLLLI